jgi:hypothetical protein
MHKEEYSDSCIGCFPEVIQMAIKTSLEPRKEWVAPSLKKVSVEEVTASSSHTRPKPDRYQGATVSS